MWWELELTQFLCPVMDLLNALILRETVIRKLAFLLARFNLLPFGTCRILNWKIIIYDRDSSTSSVAVSEMLPHILLASIYHHSVTTCFWKSGFPRIHFIAGMGVHCDLGYQFGFINLIC
ncbi:tetratricopeptide repeat protein 21A [Platysternon megacephalum]|uniref:Tetratricopeptide repeat protein 21A n=1 Tax=Platysternon megacephalum TaxID=55544 RepID=A0A4D9ECZ3_9SAUR|nr:tetratricopeptide repeat protein 21A [Platysternon megacephalum]